MMKDHYRILIVADTHIGAERRPWLRKVGVTPEQYDAPLREAVKWFRDNAADMLIVAGDVFDQRNPLPGDYARAQKIYPANTVYVAGNHDISAQGDVNALWWSDGYAMSGRPSLIEPYGTARNPGVQIVCLPWPRPSDYNADKITGWTIREEIARTRQAILEDLNDIAVNDIDQTRPAILVGHAMVSYGNTTPDDPGLMLGKDVVLPYESLTSLPNIGGVYLGHVHDPSSPAYVGSTQPTDWGEADQVKSFTVVDITKVDPDSLFIQSAADLIQEVGEPIIVNGWRYITRQIPYTTSLKLATVSNEDYELAGDYDGVRLTWTVREGDDPEQLAIAERALRDQHPYVEVIVEHEVKRAARVETIEPLAKMSPMDALGVWLEQRETPGDDHRAVEMMAHEIISDQ
jgi:DNA repair exonuclease SbcCD nuclease subunit